MQSAIFSVSCAHQTDTSVRIQLEISFILPVSGLSQVSWATKRSGLSDWSANSLNAAALSRRPPVCWQSRFAVAWRNWRNKRRPPAGSSPEGKATVSVYLSAPPPPGGPVSALQARSVLTAHLLSVRIVAGVVLFSRSRHSREAPSITEHPVETLRSELPVHYRCFVH